MPGLGLQRPSLVLMAKNSFHSLPVEINTVCFFEESFCEDSFPGCGSR